MRLAQDPIERPARLAAVLAHRRPPALRMRLPNQPHGLITRLRCEPSTAELGDEDVLTALRIIVELRHLLTYLEVKILQAGRKHAKWIRRQVLGDALGIGGTGVANRRKRLGRTFATRGRVNIHPKMPRIELATAERLAEHILDRRAEHLDYAGNEVPDPDDLFGVLAYILAHDDDAMDVVIADDEDSDEPTPLFVADLSPALRIVVALRRDLETLEADWHDLGRKLGVPDKARAAVFGRYHRTANWRALRRMRNAARPGGRHTIIPLDLVQDLDLDQAAEPNLPLGLATDDETNIRALAADLVQFHSELAQQVHSPVANDEALNDWLTWLSDAGLHQDKPRAPEAVSLLWIVIDELETIADEHSEAAHTDSDLYTETDDAALCMIQALVSRGTMIRAGLRQAARDADVPQQALSPREE